MEAPRPCGNLSSWSLCNCGQIWGKLRRATGEEDGMLVHVIVGGGHVMHDALG